MSGAGLVNKSSSQRLEVVVLILDDLSTSGRDGLSSTAHLLTEIGSLLNLRMEVLMCR